MTSDRVTRSSSRRASVGSVASTNLEKKVFVPLLTSLVENMGEDNPEMPQSASKDIKLVQEMKDDLEEALNGDMKTAAADLKKDFLKDKTEIGLQLNTREDSAKFEVSVPEVSSSQDNTMHSLTMQQVEVCLVPLRTVEDYGGTIVMREDKPVEEKGTEIDRVGSKETSKAVSTAAQEVLGEITKLEMDKQFPPGQDKMDKNPETDRVTEDDGFIREDDGWEEGDREKVEKGIKEEVNDVNKDKIMRNDMEEAKEDNKDKIKENSREEDKDDKEDNREEELPSDHEDVGMEGPAGVDTPPSLASPLSPQPMWVTGMLQSLCVIL